MNSATYRDLRRDLQATLQGALEFRPAASGTVDRAVAHLIGAVGPNDNSKRVAARKERPMSASWFSEFICDRVHVQGFVYRMNQAFARRARSQLSAFPPDRRETVVVIDGHQEPYWFEPWNHGDDCRNCKSDARCKYKFVTHTENKPAKWSHDWLAISIHWRHNGVPITCLLHLQPLLALGLGPAPHIKVCIDVLRRTRIRPTVVVVDRYYDSKHARALAVRHGLPLGQRLRWEQQRGRSFFDVEAKRYVKLDELAAMALAHGRLSTWQEPSRSKGASARIRASKSIVRRVVMFGETEPQDLVIGVELKPKPGDMRSFQASRPIAVLMPVGLGRVGLRLYGKRWTIESMFQDWSHDRPAPRPKKITTHVVQFMTFAFVRSLGMLARFAYTLANPSPTGRQRLQSVVEHTRTILGLQEPPD